jgi:ribosome-binding protein aMBF1 (putative translation factor)
MARRTIEVRKPRDIGDAIRVVRAARGISQEELAQANAYDRFYLNRLEAGGIASGVRRPARAHRVRVD